MATRKQVSKKGSGNKKKAVQAVRRPARGAGRKESGTRRKSGSPRGRKKAGAGGPSLGRPKVTGEELLFLLFKEDYHARQIFDFLRVEKVKELEQYSPQQIVRLLSRPITQTVDRVRRKLAEKNRCLRDDAEFAAEVKESPK